MWTLALWAAALGALCWLAASGLDLRAGLPVGDGTPATVPAAMPSRPAPLVVPAGNAAALAAAPLGELPAAAYAGEALGLSLRQSPGQPALRWTITDALGRSVPTHTDAEGTLVVDGLAGSAGGYISLDAGLGPWRVALPRPGQGAGLRLGRDGWLRWAAPGGDGLPSDGVLVVPVVDRVEAAEDRRWALLGDPPAARRPCTVVFSAGDTLPDLALPLHGLLVAAQADAAAVLAGQGVLVHLPTGDIRKGWRQRAYRQTLAWLVADLYARGASHVVLVQPPCPPPERPAAEPLWAAVRDVAASYRLNVVETATLADAAYWELAPGILGDQLNAQGRSARDALVAPLLAPGLAPAPAPAPRIAQRQGAP